MQAFGFELHWRAPERLINVEDYRRAARLRLPKMVWHYIEGAADSQYTKAANRSAFDDWWLQPSVLTGKDDHLLRTTVAGLELSLPVLLAPTGFTGLTSWSGDIEATRAAQQVGTRYALSTTSSWSLEEVAEAADREHIFQLYPGTGGMAADLMDRAWAAGYRTLFVTVDVPVKGNREGERRHGMGIPPVLTPRRALNFARHPRWAYNILRHRRIGGANVGEAGTVTGAIASIETTERELMQSRLNWDDLAWMRERWKGKLFLKGVLRAEDAERAVDLGCDGVIVSNHGGRQLDHVTPTLEALSEVVDAVGHRAEVLLDGGVRRGTDVVTALALGARAVLIGRPYLYGMAVSGEVGIVAVLNILRTEIEQALTLLGVGSVADLNRTHVRRAGALTVAPCSALDEIVLTQQLRSDHP